jgi:hypothetical protein
MTRTGLGEFIFHTYLTIRSSAYRHRPHPQDLKLDDSRYLVADGTNYVTNMTEYRQRYELSEGQIHKEPYDAETEALFINYCMALKEFVSLCRAANMDLLFVYYPAYTQIHEENPSRAINERLHSISEELEIDFLDLTDGLRAESTKQVLDLAPLDFHPNPAGNRAIAKLITEHLIHPSPRMSKIKPYLTSSDTK